ncbi:MAG: hypothetical protein RML45_03910 [Acetobacteraceae bacterium]|nr:hypothetical protein [Acetobacteraceae bacterium]
MAGVWLGEPLLRNRGLVLLASDLPSLVTAEGGFAQVSTRYHRLALDAIAYRRPACRTAARGGAATCGRAMTRWLARLTDVATGRTPRLGHDDGTVLADVLGSDPDDARPTLVRAEAAFGAASLPTLSLPWRASASRRPRPTASGSTATAARRGYGKGPRSLSFACRAGGSPRGRAT